MNTENTENTEGADEGRANAETSEAAATAVDPRDQRIAELEAQLKDVTGRLRAVSKAFTEQKDEMGAFRERVEAQSKLARSRREYEVVKAFFEPVQNLARSIQIGVSDPDSFMEGLRMIHVQFQEALIQLGLEKIPGVGSPFNPNLHEALAVMPVADAAQDGVVLIVHTEGFMHEGRPVKVSQVVIGKHAPAQAEQAEA